MSIIAGGVQSVALCSAIGWMPSNRVPPVKRCPDAGGAPVTVGREVSRGGDVFEQGATSECIIGSAQAYTLMRPSWSK